MWYNCMAIGQYCKESSLKCEPGNLVLISNIQARSKYHNHIRRDITQNIANYADSSD